MTVLSSTPDPEALTLTIVAEFAAPPTAVWRLWADPQRSLEFEDGFAHPDGTRDDDMPVTRMRVELEATGGGCRMTGVSRFASAEQMQQLVEMGMAEGMRLAMGQMDDLLVPA